MNQCVAEWEGERCQHRPDHHGAHYLAATPTAGAVFWLDEPLPVPILQRVHYPPWPPMRDDTP
jgi:hypothetical protein